MASIYARRHRLWCKVKDSTGKWTAQATPFNVGDEAKASAWASKLQATIAARSSGALLVSTFAKRWLDARSKRGLASFDDDVGRINNHVLPAIGHLAIAEVRPRVIRDFVRDLRASTMAPRTVLNVFGVMRTMFQDAMIEEVIPANPCVVSRGELPERADLDSEWRANATYTRGEVVAMISDERIPLERRMLNALKALAALRHGEAAGLRWRHYDTTAAPLARLLIATSYNRKRTKTNVPRRVPVHPLLGRMLDAWRSRCWPEVYGREPELDDLVIPTRAGTTVDATDANRAFKADLETLGLRVAAGEHRDRGGHDLRAWSITALQEDGANREVVTSWTHTKKADVVSGYSRFPWAMLCAEMLRLQLVVEGDPLAWYVHGTRHQALRNRWENSRPRRDSNPCYLRERRVS